MILSITGLHCCGKTTTIKVLKNILSKKWYNVKVISTKDKKIVPPKIYSILLAPIIKWGDDKNIFFHTLQFLAWWDFLIKKVISYIKDLMRSNNNQKLVIIMDRWPLDSLILRRLKLWKFEGDLWKEYIELINDAQYYTYLSSWLDIKNFILMTETKVCLERLSIRKNASIYDKHWEKEISDKLKNKYLLEYNIQNEYAKNIGVPIFPLYKTPKEIANEILFHIWMKEWSE